LSLVRQGAHDEIFSQGVPVLVGVEPGSSYAYLLQPSPSRDEPAWWLALTDQKEQRGLNLEVCIADAARGLSAGTRRAFPQVQMRGDVLHAQMEMSELSSYLERRAYARMRQQEVQEHKMARAKHHKAGQARSRELAWARVRAQGAVRLYDDMAILIGWMEELLELVGPPLEQRREL
jgi:hypothetical protein